MEKLEKSGFIFFILTYVLILVWLYQGVTNGYNFCLPATNFFSLDLPTLAAISGILTFAAYSHHSRGTMRALGIITLILGLGPALVVVAHLLMGTPICG